MGPSLASRAAEPTMGPLSGSRATEHIMGPLLGSRTAEAIMGLFVGHECSCTCKGSFPELARSRNVHVPASTFASKCHSSPGLNNSYKSSAVLRSSYKLRRAFCFPSPPAELPEAARQRVTAPSPTECQRAWQHRLPTIERHRNMQQLHRTSAHGWLARIIGSSEFVSKSIVVAPSPAFWRPLAPAAVVRQLGFADVVNA